MWDNGLDVVFPPQLCSRPFARLPFIFENWLLILLFHCGPPPLFGDMLDGGVWGGVIGSSEPDMSESSPIWVDQLSGTEGKSAPGTEVGRADVGRTILRP